MLLRFRNHVKYLFFTRVSGATHWVPYLRGSQWANKFDGGETLPTQRFKASKFSQHFLPESNSGVKVGGRVGVPSRHCPLGRSHLNIFQVFTTFFFVGLANGMRVYGCCTIIICVWLSFCP